jgi:hypothetical protein
VNNVYIFRNESEDLCFSFLFGGWSWWCSVPLTFLWSDFKKEVMRWRFALCSPT